MSGNFAIKGGGGGPLMANANLNFHFYFLRPSLSHFPNLAIAAEGAELIASDESPL